MSRMISKTTTVVAVTDMCVRIWLEVGHACEPRRSSSLGHPLALDWRVWVRGVNGNDISPFVHKVVFHLDPPTMFVYPKRVIQEPPYEIQESGCASINIPIHVYLKHCLKPTKIKLRYTLLIENITKSTAETSCVYYDFQNPSEQLQRALTKSGGEIIARSSSLMNKYGKNSLLVISDSDGKHKHSPARSKKYKFVEPIQFKDNAKKLNKDSMSVDFKKLLKSASMTDFEIDLVSQLYLSYSKYEKSADALVLPPFSDPIYRPELPQSLKYCFSNIGADYSIQ